MTLSFPRRSTQADPALRRWRTIAGAISSPWTSLALGCIAVSIIAVSLISAPGLDGVLGAGLGLMMVAIAVVDARRFIIPNALTAPAFVLALLNAAGQPAQATLPAIGLAIGLAITRGLALALFFLTVRVGYKAIRGRDGLGLGDVKLAGVAGAWLDWLMLPIAIELAAVAALLVYFLRQGALTRASLATHRLPFGLFFAPAIWLCWVIETIWRIGQ